MKKLISTLAIVGATLSLAAMSFGQAAGPQGAGQQGAGQQKGKAGNQRQGGGGAMRGAKMMEEMFAKLNLSAEQKTKIKALVEKRQEKMKALRAEVKAGADRTQIRAKFKPIMEEFQSGLKTILTKEQFTKLGDLMAEARKENRGAGSDKKGAAGAKKGGAKGDAKKGGAKGGAKGGGL